MLRALDHRIVAAALLALFALTGVVAARTHTPTVDEFVYVPAGYYHLVTGDLSFDPTNPPLLKMAMAVPLLWMGVHVDTDPRWRRKAGGWEAWIFGTHFLEANRDRYLDAFFAARLVVLAIGVALGAMLYAEARRLLTPLGAVAALALYCTSPTVIAHASLATLDVGETAVLFAMFVTLARFTTTKDPWWAAATGVLAGVAFAVKGVAILFVPLVALVAAAEWRTWDAAGARRLVLGLAAMPFAAWVAVLLVYRFSGFPLPAPVLEGIRFQAASSSSGEYPAFLNGHWSQTGWWYYYLFALAVKTPIATLVLLAVGVWATARRRFGTRGDWWLVIPPVGLLYVLSFHYGKDYGIRYLLPAFPFLLLLAGRGVDALVATGRRGAAVVAVVVAWQLVACVATTPHQLAYFNELAGGPDHARRLLLDSNLDWGQDLGRLKDYLRARGTDRVCLGYFGHVDPHLYGIEYTLPPPTPTAGLCAVSANFLAGYPYAVTYAGERILGVRAGAWSWFDRLRPVARVGRSIYVFDVTDDDARRLRGAD